METNSEYRRRRIWDIIIKVLLAIFLLLLILCILKIFLDCREVRKQQQIWQEKHEVYKRTGDIYEDIDPEHWEVIPDTIAPYKEEELDSLPPAVSLEAFFPPIGDQNPHGTCVVWATGYNLTTALKAIKYHWTQDDLKNPANQVSPKDLMNGIDADSKPYGCDGTFYDDAFNVLTTTGAASMEKVPYNNLGSCNGKHYGDPDNVLRYYKRVISANGELPSAKQIKAYISDTIPLVVSAHVGDRFMEWSGDAVVDDDTYLKPGQMHAHHAMVITGYDDAKNAFRLRNSWGEEWGDEGSVWVDYDYFMSGFGLAIFMAEK